MEASSSTPSKQGDNHGTRRNTRSTSNQDNKEKDNADGNKNSSSGSNNSKEQDVLMTETSRKKQSERIIRASNGDVLEYTTEDDITYRPMDSAYLATERPDSPYFICTIQDIKVSKRDNAMVSVKWYYRPTEVPDLVYQMLVKDRYNQVVDPAVKELVMTPDVVNRELFVDDRLEATDTYPISCLRGKCDVTHFSGISDIKNFELLPDHFFYIYNYSPDTRRLASSKGETRVGPSHQWNASMRGIFQKAELPDLLKPAERGYQKGRVYEEITWEPKVNKCDLIACLQAARSLAAFAGVCDGVSPEEGCIVASRDDTTINALRVLFENNGNPRKAIEVLVKNPVPVTIDSKWTEEQVKRFQRGLKVYGKNFFNIRKELLPTKATSELVEFYYLWKKTQDNLMIRPHHRKHGRQAAMKKSGKLKTNGNGSGDHTSTEEETEESEESEKEINVTKKCKHCETSTSKDWIVGGKDSVMLCTDCRIFFKKYGENRPVIKVEDIDSANETDINNSPTAKSQVPPFLFKPIKEVNNLIPRKPAKSLANVNAPTEIKVRTEKPSKRQWSDSDEPNEKREVLSTKLKRPKTEADSDSHTNQDTALRTSISTEITHSEVNRNAITIFKEQEPLSAANPLPPSIIPEKYIHTNDSASVTHSLGKPSISRSEHFASKTSKHHPMPYGVKSSPLSINSTPFVSTGQIPHIPSGKPSELEYISKLASNKGLIARNIYPTVGYVGAGTPLTLPSQVSATGQTSSTYSSSATTTVTTTNPVRSNPTVEPSGSNLPRSSDAEDPGRPRPREALPMRDSFHSSQRAVDPACHPGSRLSPLPRTNIDENKAGQYHRPKIPPTSTIRNPRFPFDPCVTDQIISNANISRPSIKEEAGTISPTRHLDSRRPPHSDMGPMRTSPVPHHYIKQESYPGSINRSLYMPVEPIPHLPYAGHQYPHAQSPNPHGSHFPRHPHLPHRGVSGQPLRPSSQTQVYTPPAQGQPPASSQYDSDIEVISETPIKEPASFGNSAKFIKIWDRGSNSCFRTDYIYAPDESSTRKRMQKFKEFKKEQPQTSKAPTPDPSKHAPLKRPRTPSSRGCHPSSDQDRKKEERTESLDRSRREGPCSLSSSSLPPQAHRTTPSHAGVPMTTPARTPTTSYDQHPRPTQASFVSPLGSDTPALRQLQQYASFDMRRNAAEAAMGSVHPLYYLAAAENEREMRERDRFAKMGADMKPPDMLDPHHPNFSQLTHSAMAAGFHMGSIPVSITEQQLAMEQQLQLRQYQAHFLNSLPPGTNPQMALAVAAAHMPPGMMTGGPINPEAYAERLSAERLQAERLAAEQYQLELLHHHSHSHVHSHLHLHPPGHPGGPPLPGTPLPLCALPPPHGLTVADQLINPYAAAMQAMNPYAAVSAGNPMLNPMLRSQQAALMQQGLAAPHLQAAAAAAAREQAPQPHPFTHHLQAVHEQHVIESQRARAAALQEQQFLPATRYKP